MYIHLKNIPKKEKVPKELKYGKKYLLGHVFWTNFR
jgi:hypothetical protein